MKYLLMVLFLIAGCSEGELGKIRYIEYYESHCTEDSTDKRAKFILECIEAANPKSDEEPEDWIKKCQEMAEGTYCPKVTVIREQRCDRESDFSGSCASFAWKDVDIKIKNAN